MTLLRKNITANLVGNIWQAFTGLVFIPLYIKFMGVESYGLIGIFITLQAVFSLLDMGLSSTLNRELARLSVLPDSAQEMRNVVRTLEIIYWSMAALIGIVIIVTAPSVAHYWIKPGKLSPRTVEQAILIMGLSVALQWPVGFYSGGLMGLQRQVLLNAINIGISTLRGAGAVLTLWLISPTIQAFFLWQIFISATNSSVLALSLWRQLPGYEKKPFFQIHILAKIWRFAAGMSGITLLATLLTHLDKIILSKMLSLEMFGYYTLASTVGMGLSCFFGPFFSGIYPRFTQLVSSGNERAIEELYHKSCQFISVLIMPACVVIVLYSYEIVLLWTQNQTTALNAHVLVSILICGTALNGLMNIPYALQLAHGWTKLSFYSNLTAVILLVPMIIYMTRQYGAQGAASVWVILNSGYVLIAIHFMHRRLLPQEKWRWYYNDIGAPLLGALMPAGLCWFFVPVPINQINRVLYLTMISAASFGMAALTTPVTRNWLLGQFSKIHTQPAAIK